ncbi:hypothetical protein K438DRAFT_1845615 [Mycena galopus ATCC 62051]|nr:hypothetical protein K438DRAFT_1845615 [Mycena galopus ATCC 62051]
MEDDYSPEVVSRYHRKLAEISPWTESTAQALQNTPNAPPTLAHPRALPRPTPKSTSAMRRAQSSESTPEEEERPQSRDPDESGENAQSITRRDRLAHFFAVFFRPKKSNSTKERAQDNESSPEEEECEGERVQGGARDERWARTRWSTQANLQWDPDREELVNRKLAEISQWSESTAQTPQKNPYAPPTPAHPSVAIPRSKSKPRAQTRGRDRMPPQPLPIQPPLPPPLPIPWTAPPRRYVSRPPQPPLIQTQRPNAFAPYVYPSTLHAHSTTLAPATTKVPLKRVFGFGMKKSDVEEEGNPEVGRRRPGSCRCGCRRPGGLLGAIFWRIHQRTF